LTAENRKTHKDLDQVVKELEDVYRRFWQVQQERDHVANELQQRLESASQEEQDWKREKQIIQQNVDQLRDELERRSAAKQEASALQLAMERLQADYEEVCTERGADAQIWKAREALLEQQVNKLDGGAVQAWMDEDADAPGLHVGADAFASRPQTAPIRHSPDATMPKDPPQVLAVDHAAQARLASLEDELRSTAAELTAQQEHAAEEKRRHRSEHRALQREKEKAELKLRSELKEVKAKARAAEVRELQWRDEWRMSSGVPGLTDTAQNSSDTCRWDEFSVPTTPTQGTLRRPSYATAMRKKVLVASSPMLSLVKNWEHVERGR